MIFNLGCRLQKALHDLYLESGMSISFQNDKTSCADLKSNSNDLSVGRALPIVGRRGVLALLGGLATTGLAFAQEQPAAPAAPIVPTPTPVPAPTPNITINPAVARPVAPAVSSTPTGLGPIDRTSAYYLFFQQNIDLNSIKTLRGYLVALVEGGVKDMTVVLGSNGGLVVVALELYQLIRMLPISLKTHAQIFVASAANILYLAGDERSAEANAKFIYHPGQTPLMGSFSSPQLQDQLAVIEATSGMVDSIYRERTKLPYSEIQRFARETVIYSSAQSIEYGIAQSISSLKVMPGANAKFVFVD